MRPVAIGKKQTLPKSPKTVALRNWRALARLGAASTARVERLSAIPVK